MRMFLVFVWSYFAALVLLAPFMLPWSLPLWASRLSFVAFAACWSSWPRIGVIVLLTVVSRRFPLLLSPSCWSFWRRFLGQWSSHLPLSPVAFCCLRFSLVLLASCSTRWLLTAVALGCFCFMLVFLVLDSVRWLSSHVASGFPGLDFGSVVVESRWFPLLLLPVRVLCLGIGPGWFLRPRLRCEGGCFSLLV